MYGVSDNAVNKWCKFYEIKKPGRGDWEKIKYGKLDKPEFQCIIKVQKNFVLVKAKFDLGSNNGNSTDFGSVY